MPSFGPNAFSVSKGVTSGRFKFYIYRQAPPDKFSQAQQSPSFTPLPGEGNTESYICEGDTSNNIQLETICFCLYDYDNNEHIEYINNILKDNVHLHSVDAMFPLYKLQNDIKMFLWSLLNNCSPNTQYAITGSQIPGVQSSSKRIRNIGFVVYPLMGQDELECILRAIIPLIRPYYCFKSNETVINVTLFVFVPPDASLYPRLVVIGQSLNTNITVTCISGQNACISCADCKNKYDAMVSLFFKEPVAIENTINLAKLVQKLEHKLMCMGNIKGLIVSSKMQNIFNRMQYIEEKYRNLQHHLMTDTTYDGMLSDIEHIESKIKEVAVQIPLSYIEGNNMVHKILTYKPQNHTHGSSDSSCGTQHAGHAHAHHAHPSLNLLHESLDSFFIPGLSGVS